MLADYLQRRDELIAEDRALRIDHVRANYSVAELKADEVVRSIRAKEEVSVWAVDHENVPHPYPGMEFLHGMRPDSRLALPLTCVQPKKLL
jgi:adenosine deaminase CECR1